MFPSTAFVDNNETSIELIYRNQGNQDHIFLRFPYFEHSLIYDPVLGIGLPSNSPSLVVFTIALSVGVIVILMVRAKFKK